MSDRITKVFEHDDFAIWHVPQANGYVYEAAGIAVDADSYADCPFESTYDDALNAACELYDVEVGSLSTPLPVVYSNALFKVYQTPAGGYIHVACDDDAETPTDQNVQAHPGEVYKRKEDAVIAAFEQDLARRAMPMHIGPMSSRRRVRRNCMLAKPLPGSPSTWASGTRQSSNTSS